MSGIGCLYQSGVDRLGRPVVVFVGKWFPYNKVNLDKVFFCLSFIPWSTTLRSVIIGQNEIRLAPVQFNLRLQALLYLINLLDPIVRGDYVIAYFHTLTNSSNYPSFTWLREVYNVLPYKYKKNLKAFYVIHPTFWTKVSR